jgi:hypothetical protein
MSNASLRSTKQIESCDARTAPLNQSPLISDVLPFGRSWYGEPNAVSNAINYAKFFSRSHDAVIRVCDEAGNVIETHEDAAISKSAARSKCLRLPRQSAILKRTLLRNNWAMETQAHNINVIRSVWRRIKKADIKVRDLQPVKDVKGGGGVTGKSKPITGGTGTK